MEINYKELYEKVSEQIRMEFGFAKSEVNENPSEYNRGILGGYRLIVEHVLDVFEKEYGLK